METRFAFQHKQADVIARDSTWVKICRFLWHDSAQDLINLTRRRELDLHKPRQKLGSCRPLMTEADLMKQRRPWWSSFIQALGGSSLVYYGPFSFIGERFHDVSVPPGPTLADRMRNLILTQIKLHNLSSSPQTMLERRPRAESAKYRYFYRSKSF